MKTGAVDARVKSAVALLLAVLFLCTLAPVTALAQESPGAESSADTSETPDASEATEPEAPAATPEEAPQATPEAASFFLVGDLYYNILDATTVAVRGSRVATITSHTIPPAVTYNGTEYTVVAISDNAFICNTSTYLAEVHFPDTLKTIGQYAFRGCSLLTSISLPAGLETIDARAFAFCEGLTEVRLPAGLKTLGEGAFISCKNLADVTLPDSLQTLDDFVFAYCAALTSFNFPASLQTIGAGAFMQSGLTSVSFPASLQTIGDRTFMACTSLASVSFPSGLQAIGEAAFRDCIKLTSLSFPSGLQTLGRLALYNCYSVKALTFLGATPPTLGDSPFSFLPSDGTLHCPQGADYSTVLAALPSGWALATGSPDPTDPNSPDPNDPAGPGDNIQATGVALSMKAKVLKPKKTVTLKATVLPANASDKTVSWKSSKPSVAAVKNGKVTAKKDGTAKITATTPNGKKASCTITVSSSKVAVSQVKLTKPKSNTLKQGAGVTLKAQVSPANASTKKVSWSSANTDIAKVSSKGKVTAVAPGKVKITVTSHEGGKKASVTLTVKPK